MKKLNPYIGFGGQCREAMNFYRDCFGGELNVIVADESAISDQIGPDANDDIVHASLESASFTLMGTDMGPPDGGVGRNTVSICVDCSDEAELTRYFNHLTEGGNVFCPVGPAFWGGTFGATTDKYGVMWLFNFTK